MALFCIFNYNFDFLKTDRTHKNSEYIGGHFKLYKNVVKLQVRLSPPEGAVWPADLL